MPWVVAYWLLVLLRGVRGDLSLDLTYLSCLRFLRAGSGACTRDDGT